MLIFVFLRMSIQQNQKLEKGGTMHVKRIELRSVANVKMVCVEKARNFTLRKGEIGLYYYQMKSRVLHFFGPR